MKLIVILLGLLVGVSGKPSIKIVTGLLDNIIHTVLPPKTSQNPTPLPYQQNAAYINPPPPYTQVNINVLPNPPTPHPGYPVLDPYYNSQSVPMEVYTLPSGIVEPLINKQTTTTELYPASGPAGIYDNIIFVQDPPEDDINKHEQAYNFPIDVRSGM